MMHEGGTMRHRIHISPRSTETTEESLRSKKVINANTANVGRNARARGVDTSVRFSHNARLWVLGGPSLGVLLLLGGRPTCLVAAFGVMVSYCFDLADIKEMSLVCVWGSVLTTTTTLLWGGSALGLIHCLCLASFALVLGIWATLQFCWVLREERDSARLLERLLFTCFPLLSANVITWGVIAYGGAGYASPCLLLTLYAGLALYGVPLKSAVGGGEEGGVHGKRNWTSPVLAACLMILPVLMQVSVDKHLLLRGGTYERYGVMLKVVLALTLPWPLLCSIKSRGVLWWAETSIRNKLEKVLSVGGVLGLFLSSTIILSVFVVPAIAPYTRVPPPMNTLSAMASLWLILAAWLVHDKVSHGTIIARLSVILSVRSMTWLFGMNDWIHQACFIPFSVAMASYIFASSHGRNPILLYYMWGVSAFVLCYLWINKHSLHIVNFNFTLVTEGGTGMAMAEGVGGVGGESAFGMEISLVTFMLLSGLLGILALGVPILLVARARIGLVGCIVSLHAVCLLLAEMVLISAGSMPYLDTTGASHLGVAIDLEDIYPLSFVVATGFGCVWMAGRLWSEWKMGTLYLWVTGCVNVGKVVSVLMVAIVENGTGSTGARYILCVIPMIALNMAVTAPSTLFQAQRPMSSSGGGGVGGEGERDWEGPMLPLESALCVFFMANALWVSADPIIKPLLSTLLGSDVGGVKVVATCGFFLGVFVLEMVGRHFPNSVKARRIGTTVLALSLSLPFLVLDTAAQVGLGGVTSGESEGAVGGGAWQQVTWRETFARLVMLVCVARILLELGGVVSVTSLPGRIGLALTVGGSLGSWLALSSSMLSSTSETAWAAAGGAVTLSAASMVIMETAFPRVGLSRRVAGGGGGGGCLLVECYLCALVAMPVAVIGEVCYCIVFKHVGILEYVDWLVSGGRAGAGHVGWHGGVEVGVMGKDMITFSLLVWLCGQGVMSLALKVLSPSLIVPSQGGAHGGTVGQRSGQSQEGVRIGLDRFTGLRRAWFGREARWVPVLGNLSTVMALVSAICLSWVMFPDEGSRVLSVLPACSILLLLQNDGRLLRGLGLENRYAVVLGVISTCWVTSSLYYILMKGYLSGGALDSDMERLSGYMQLLAHKHGMYSNLFGHTHGQTAVALLGVSIWTSGSPWRPLWNIILLASSIPSHVRLVTFLWGGRQGSLQRDWKVLGALVVNLLPLTAGDLSSINLMGAVGLSGGSLHLWLAHKQRQDSMQFL